MPRLPERIARYQIEALIGRGGMGLVYLAWDPRLRRRLAIKILRTPDDEELRARFEREARAAAGLRHRHIVTIFDVDVHDDCPFIAMEYVDGDTLDSLIRQHRRPPLDRQLDWLIQLCDGLGYAHGRRVVHRDIKPANVMIDGDRAVKILDFGIARAAADAGHTRTGALIGSIHYMSPEAIAGEPVDARSDMFAVGLLMYELLTGRRAFDGPSDTAVLNRIASAEPEPIDSFVTVPPPVAAIVARALQKVPSSRFADLEQMGRALTEARAQLDQASVAPIDQASVAPTRIRDAVPQLNAPDRPAVVDTRPVPVHTDSSAAPPQSRRVRPAIALVGLALAAVFSFAWWTSLPAGRPPLPELANAWLAPIPVPVPPDGPIVRNVPPDPRGPADAGPGDSAAVTSPDAAPSGDQAAASSAEAVREADSSQIEQPDPQAAQAGDPADSPDAGGAAPVQSEIVDPVAVGKAADLSGDSSPGAAGEPGRPAVQRTPEMEVLETLQTYVAAYGRRDFATLERVLSSAAMRDLKSAFARAQRLEISIDAARVVSITADTAVVQARVTDGIVPLPGSGNPARNTSTATFRLRKENGQWIIVDRTDR